MIKEIKAKVLLSHYRQPDPWFGLKYNMNLYRGCQHQCIYCDSRSECYRIENFNDILVKINAVELLKKELPRKRVKGTIGFGAMNDCYMPLERKLKLTRKALEVIAEFKFPVHILTKSDLVLRDLDVLKEISKVYAAVSFTITTADDELGKKVEPNAPLVSKRYKAIKTLSEHGIYAGITMMPILPFLEDTEENITAIVKKAHYAKAKYIIPSFGMTLRDRQRDYYYRKLDELFPGLSQKYRKSFGERYSCAARNAKKLNKLFKNLCKKHEIATRITPFKTDTSKQLNLVQLGNKAQKIKKLF
ncbi:radical SAM protein [Candidatus Dojkabacteria bacterium]|nr:radical SAM protein [Candidatus Dojkabacteria bacterium]